MHMYEHLFLIHHNKKKKFQFLRLFLWEENLIYERRCTVSCSNMWIVFIPNVGIRFLEVHTNIFAMVRAEVISKCVSIGYSIDYRKFFGLFLREIRLKILWHVLRKVQTSCYIGIINIAHGWIGCFMIFTCYLSLTIVVAVLITECWEKWEKLWLACCMDIICII